MKLWTPPGADTRSAQKRADDEHVHAVREAAVRDLNRARHLLHRLQRKRVGSNGRRKDLDQARKLVVRADVSLQSVGNKIHKIPGATALMEALVQVRG